MKRILTIFLTLTLASVGLVAIETTPANASPLPVTCGGWHYITAAQTNLNVRADPASGGLWAEGRQGVEPWYQKFSFCRNSGWGPNLYLIESNSTGEYWGPDPAHPVWAHLKTDYLLDYASTFEVTNYDAKFSIIKKRGALSSIDDAYVYAEETSGFGALMVDRGLFLGGSNLFVITPRDPMA
jgi:hypothetical protein